MVRRRESRVRPRKSLLLRIWLCLPARMTGSTRWFDTIVASASAATITIDVADENPPKNARMARLSYP